MRSPSGGPWAWLTCPCVLLPQGHCVVTNQKRPDPRRSSGLRYSTEHSIKACLPATLLFCTVALSPGPSRILTSVQSITGE